MVEEGIVSLYLSICKSNNKYMKDYDKNKEFQYSDLKQCFCLGNFIKASNKKY